jgi:hypothetical protein
VLFWLHGVFQASPILVVRTGDFSKMIGDGTKRKREHAVKLSEAPEVLANCYVTKLADLEQFIKVVKSVEDFLLTIVKLPQGKTP